MSTKEKIIEHIKKTYFPIAIVLSGSRASNNFSLASDWDFYVFTDKEFKFGFDSFENETLDISTEKYPVSDDFIFNTKYHPEQFLEIVFDKSGGWIEKAVERTQDKYLAGPESVQENEYLRLKKIMLRYIQKVEARKNIQGLSFYYLGIFYEIALRLWFQFKKQWPLSPHESLSYIEKNDPVFFKLLDDISKPKDIETQLTAAKSVYNILFNR
jgi:hypothetical protein